MMIPVLTALIAILGAFAVNRFNARRTANQTFRERFIFILGRFYPPPGRWEIGFEPELKRLVAELEPDVMKFRFFLADGRRRRFDEDWVNFKSHAVGLSWNALAGRTLYPSMADADARNPIGDFYALAANLLNHAGEA